LRDPGRDKPEDQQVKRERELDAVSKPPAVRRKPKHLSKHPLKKRAQGFPKLGSQEIFWGHRGVFGHPVNVVVEVEIANVEVVQ
jgi:hypothetical protein